ncbi:MAG TPA: lysophospholipid acyltransferase family protein [Polyangia bacterium]|nr:lysophospholipid acyltransferase family protein [Polyangia bacterium]
MAVGCGRGDGALKCAGPVLYPLLNVLQVLFLAGWSAVWISVALVTAVVTRKQELALSMARRFWAPGLRWAAGARVVVEPFPVIDWSRPHVFVMNHQSSLDIVAAFLVLPVNLRFVAKHVLKYVPFLGWYMWATGMIFVHRTRHGSSMGSLREAGGRVHDGANVLVFPEGTRSRDGQLLPFKKGAFVLAATAGVPIVPVAIEGSGRCMPADGFRVRPGVIRIKVGEPIPTTGPLKGDIESLVQETRAAIDQMMGSLRPSPVDPVAARAGSWHDIAS